MIAARRLLLSTALGTGLLLGGTAARAQALPGKGDFVSGIDSHGNSVTPADSSFGTDAVSIGLADKATVLNWGKFNIPGGKSIGFTDAAATPGSAMTVLNRVVGTTDGNGVTTIPPSVIAGQLNAPSNIAVYLVNPSGIVFKSGSAVNVGGLIASSLSLTDTDFFAGTLHFTPSGTTNGIQVEAGAGLTTTGSRSLSGLRSDLVLIGASVAVGTDTDGSATLTAQDGDVGLVAATDVTITSRPGSPLAMTIDQGTAIAGAFKVNGTLSGRNVTLALATKDAVTDTLLSVSGVVTATGATATDHGVILSADRAVTDSVTLNADGVDSVAAATIGATVTSAASLTAAAAGALTASSTMALSGDYTATGSSVILGTTGVATAQDAAGAITINATGGTITGRSGLTLHADTAGNGTQTLTLATIGTTGGNIAMAGTKLIAGSDSQSSAVRIGSAFAINTVTLGDVTASSLLGASGSSSYAVGITRNAAIATGNITLGTNAPTGTDSALRLTATGASLTTGNLATTGALSLGAGGAIQTGALSANAISIGGTGNFSASDTITSSGTITINRTGTLTLTALSAASDIQIGQGTTPSTITATGTITSNLGAVAIRSSDAQDYGDAVSAGTALTLISQNGAISLPQASGATGITIQSGGDAHIGTANASGIGADIAITAGGDAFISGAVTAGGAYQVTASSMSLGSGVATDTVLQRGGSVLLIAGSGAVSGDASLTLRSVTGSLVIDGAGGIALDAASRLEGGIASTGDIGLRSGSGQAIALGVVTARRLTGTDASHALTASLAAAGPLTFGGTVTTTQTLNASATGTITANQIDITGAGQSLILAANGATADLSANGPLSAGSLSLTAGRALSAGALTTSAGNATITAGGTATVNGAVAIAGTYAVNGTDIRLGGALAATGAITLTATQSIASITAGSLTPNAPGGGINPLTLRLTSTDPAAALRLDLHTGGDIRIDTGTSPLAALLIQTPHTNVAISLSDVRTGMIASRIDGNLLFSNGLTSSHTSGIQAGDITLTGGQLALSARNGPLNLGALTAPSIALSALSLSTGDVTTSSGSATFSASTQASILGTVSVTGGDYRVTGSSVTLGPALQSATGAVAIEATGGTLTGQSGLTLQSNSDRIGGEALTLTTSGSTGGDIALTGTTLQGGTARQSAVQIRSRVTTNAVTLGDISAASLLGAVGTGTFTTGLSRTAAITVRDVALTGALSLGTGSTLTAHDLSGQSVTLSATGALATRAVTATTGDLSISGGTLSLGDLSASNGALSLTATTGNLAVATLVAGTNASLTATNGVASVTGALSLPGDYAVTGRSVALGTAGVDTVQEARGTITISATGGTITGRSGLTLHADTNGDGTQALTLVTSGVTGGNIAMSGTTLIAGNATRRSAVQIRSAFATNAVALGDVTASSLLGAVGGLSPYTNGITRTAAITTGDITLGTNSALQLTANAGALTTGALATSGTLSLSSSGLVQTGALSGSAITIGAGSSATIAGDVTASGTYQVTAASIALGDGTTPVLQRAGSIRLISTSGAISGDAGLTLRSDTGTLALTGAGGIALDAASRLEGGASGTVTLSATAGNATVGTLIAGTDASITADAGAVSIASLTTGGNATIHAGSIDLTSAIVTGTTSLTSITGNINASSLSSASASIAAQGNASITGGSLNITQVSAATGGVTLTATSGNATIGTISAGTDISVSATRGTAAVTGDVTASGTYQMTGAAIALGDGTTPVLQRAGSIQLISTRGAISGDAGLTLRSDISGTGTGTLAIDGAGGIALDAASRLEGGVTNTGDIGIRSGIGQAIALGIVAARRLTGADATSHLLTNALITTGPLTFGGTVTTTQTFNASVAGAVTTGRIDVTGAGQDLILTATGGAGNIAALGPLTAARNLALTASGALTVTSATGTTGTANLSAGATLTGTSLIGGITASATVTGALTLATLSGQTGVTAQGARITLDNATSTTGPLALTATAGDLTVTNALSGGRVTLIASGGVAIDSASAGAGSDLTISSGADLRGVTPGTRTTSAAGRDITVTAGGAVLLATATGSRNAKVTGGSLDITQLAATSGTATLSAAAGNATVATLIAGMDAGITADAGLASIGSLTTGGNATIHAASITLPLARITGTASLTSIAGGINADDLLAASTTIGASGDTTLGRIETTSGALTAGASGALTAATLIARGAGTISGATLDIGSAGSGATLALTSTGGLLRTAQATGATGLTILSAGDAQIDTASATGATADLSITANGLRGRATGARTTLSAGRTLTVTLRGGAQIGAATAGTSAALSAAAIDLSTLDAAQATLTALGGGTIADRITTTGIATLTATGAATIGTLTAGGNVALDAGTLAVTALTDGGTLSARSRTGTLALTSVSVAGDVTINAATDAMIGQASSSAGGIDITAAGILTAPSLTAAALLKINAAAAAIGSARADRIDLTARSGSLQLGDATAVTNLALTKQGASGGLVVTGPLAVTGTTGDATLTSATDLSLRSLTTGRDALVSASGTLLGTDVTVTAGGLATVTGAVSVASYTVQGASVVLGTTGSAIKQSATGAVSIVATAGTITGRNGLTLSADADSDGAGDMILRATSGITFAPGTSLSAATARLSPGNGAALTLDRLTARTLVSYDPALAATALMQSGPVTIDTLTLRDPTTIALTGAGSALTFDTVTSTGALSLTTQASLTATTLTSGALTIDAANATIGTINAASLSATSRTGALDLASVTTQGAATLAAATDLRLNALDATGAITASAGGDIGGHAGGTTTSATWLSRSGTATITTLENGDAGGTVTLASLQAAGDIALSGRQIALGTARSDSGAITLSARQRGATATVVSLSATTLDAGTSLTATSGIGSGAPVSASNGAITLGTATARNGALTLTTLDGTVTGLTADSPILTAQGSGGDILVTTGGLAAIGTATAARDLLIRSGDPDVASRSGRIAIGSMSVGRTLSLLTFNAIATNPSGITAGDATAIDATIRASGAPATVILGPLDASGMTVLASSGDLTLSSPISTSGSLAIDAAGLLSATNLSTGGALSISAGTANLAFVRGAGGIGVTAATIAAGDLASSAGAIRLTTTSGALSLTTAIAAGGIALSTPALATIGTAHAGGALTLAAGTLSLTDGSAASAILSTTGAAKIARLVTNTGSAAITSGGLLDITQISTATGLTLASADRIVSTSLSAGGAADVRGQTLDLKALTSGGTLTLAGGAGGATLGAIATTGDTAVTSATTLGIGSLTSSAGAVTLSAAGAITADTLGSALGLTATAGQIALTNLRAGGTLTLTTQSGPLTLTSATIGGGATLSSAGGLSIERLSAGQDVTLSAAGEVTIRSLASGTASGAQPLLEEKVLAAVAPSRGFTLTARNATIDALSTSGPIAITATAGNLALGSLAGSSATLTASGIVAVSGAATIAGDVAIRAAAIALGNTSGTSVAQSAGGTVTLTADSAAITGNAGLTLSSGAGGIAMNAGGTNGAVTFAPSTTINSGTGTLSITTVNMATLGTATGRTVALTANDLTLAGPITATSITLTNRTPANLTRLGDAPADAGTEFAANDGHFDLSAAEMARLSAATLIVDAGTGAVRIGDLALAPAAGSALFQIRTTGRMDMLGRFTATGSTLARMIVLGGSADDDDRASVLRVAATAAGGGRVMADGATLDLRADTIGVGLDGGFLDAIGVKSGTPATAADVSTRFVSQSGSSLYNATLGNAGGLYSDPVTLQAGRMIVRYANFALFQNTGTPGTQTGLVLGGEGQPQTLQLAPAAGTNAFAMFGTINGIGSNATSLLSGATLVVGSQVTRANSRANGCLIGAAGGGCLSASLVQPTLSVFDTSRANVFRRGDDLTLPFDPLVGTSNESLFSDISSVASIGEDVQAVPAKGQ